MLKLFLRVRYFVLTLGLLVLLVGCGGSGSSSNSADARSQALAGQSSWGAGASGLNGFTGGPNSPGPGTGVPIVFNPGGGNGDDTGLSASPPTSLTLQGGNPLTLAVGATLPLQITVVLADGTAVNVNSIQPQAVTSTFNGVQLSFLPTASNIASINPQAIVTGIAAGSTSITVTATTNGGQISNSVPVIVTDSGSAPLSFLFTANPTPSGDAGWIARLGIFAGGVLEALGPRIPNDGRPGEIARSPDGNFVYAVNLNSGDITPYAVTRPTGDLTRIGTANIPVDPGLQALTFTPNQAFAYASSSNGDVHGFRVEPDGWLTPLGVLANSAGSSLDRPVVNPAGDHLYMTANLDDLVRIFAIDTGTGALTPITTVPAGDGPLVMAFAPNLPFAYVSNVNSDTIVGYSVSGGNLTLLTPDDSFPTGQGPFYMRIHPTLPVVYSACSDQTIRVFSINSTTGALTQVDSEPSDGTGNPVIDPSGNFLYLPRGNDISTFTIAADGILTRGPDFSDPVLTGGFGATGVTIDNN
jgi:6-phosphogluconolactonase (cycloisomerase 2 family)